MMNPSAQERYQTPPKAIADLVDTPLTPMPLTSPNRRTLLLVEVPASPTIAEVAQPELRLAGLRLNPRTNGPSRKQHLGKMSFLDLVTREQRDITGVPEGARVADAQFAPDSSKLAFTITEDDGIYLWVAEVASGHARRLSTVRLNAVPYGGVRWAPDAGSFFCRTIPAGRGPEPAADPTPSGPIILENSGGVKKAARTDPDLLKNAHDEDVLDHYLTTQVARIGLDGSATPIGKPGLVIVVAPSPDGRHLLVDTMHRPYSYRVPIERFPYRVEVWDTDGNVLRTFADNPLADQVSVHFSAVRPGPRDHDWRSDADATICWVEARDGGDPARPADIRDELRCWAAPFEGEPRLLFEATHRIGDVRWANGGLALVGESWWDTRLTRTTRIAPDDPTVAPRVLWDRSWEDRYGDPGRPFMRSTGRGSSVLLVTPENGLILVGAGASPEGDRPFIDRLDLATQTTARAWRSEAPHYEVPFAALDERGARFLTRREGVAEQPQYYIRALAGGTEKLSDFPHPAPSLAGVQKRLLRYQRPDGVDLTARLYLPPGYEPEKDGRLPLLLWIYPQEFKSADAAGQVNDSPFRFARVDAQGPLFALLDGFAVLDGPTLPIVGEGKTEPNDTYREQLIAGAQAAIDEVVRLGIGDRTRVAVGGHSYGAFTTANLLAHSDLFRAGIARSGAYNRTLTPFGFQQEQRNFWEAPETYNDMSPFTHAGKIKTPLLIIHGQVDNNPGTFPIQSERFFEALQGLGATVRLVMLPAETHGYRARESVLHMLWEQHEWLEKHVKPAAPPAA